MINERYCPCDMDDPDGVEMNFLQLENKNMSLLPVQRQDFDSVLKKCKASVSQ